MALALPIPAVWAEPQEHVLAFSSSFAQATPEAAPMVVTAETREATPLNAEASQPVTPEAAGTALPNSSANAASAAPETVSSPTISAEDSVAVERNKTEIQTPEAPALSTDNSDPSTRLPPIKESIQELAKPVPTPEKKPEAETNAASEPVAPPAPLPDIVQSDSASNKNKGKTQSKAKNAAAAGLPDGTENLYPEEAINQTLTNAEERSRLEGNRGQDELFRALLSTYQSNPQIKAERETLKTLDERVYQAVSGFLPTANATYQAGRQRTSFDEARYRYGDTRQRLLVLEQPIFSGGGTVSQWLSARNVVLAGRERLRQVEQERLQAATQAYMDVVQNSSVLELSNNNVEVLKRQLEATRERFAVGEVTRTDVAQSEARLSRAMAEQAQSQGDLENARASFLRVVGYEAPLGLTMPNLAPGLPASFEEGVEVALKNNPQLLEIKFRREAAGNDVYTQFSRLLPEVSVQGRLSREPEGAGSTGTSSFNEDSVVLNVRIPLYQGGAEYSRVREAKKLSQRREFDVMDATDGIREIVKRAWENYQTARATIEANRDAIRAAQIALDGVRQEQQFGTRTTLDVLDAEQELFVARVNLVRSQRNEIVTMYNLLSALGRFTAKDLGLTPEIYDPEEHYDRVKFLPIGF